jgi:hypothetical protein
VLRKEGHDRNVRSGDEFSLECDAEQQRNDAFRDGPHVVLGGGVMRNDADGSIPVLVLTGSIGFENQLAVPNDQHRVNISAVGTRRRAALSRQLLGDLAENRGIEADVFRRSRFPVVELLGRRRAGCIRGPGGAWQ